MPEEFDIWGKIAEHGSIILLMSVIIFWLLKEKKEKDKKIDELNGYINKINKENLMVLSSINSSLDKFIDAQKTFGEKIIEHHNTKAESINDKIDNMKGHIDVKMTFLMDKLK